jgi:electron transport complex protein RnfC
MKSSAFKLFRIRGGVHPNSRKEATCGRPIEELPMPELLRIPLQQHIGAPAEPVVKRGDHVLKGQLLAHSQGAISAPVHAPTSGYIRKIGKYSAPHPSGLPVRTITLEADGKNQWIELDPQASPLSLEPEEIATRVAAAGIVGMGGATFPSAVKLSLPKRYDLHTLVINGAECEPFLTCDDRLMRELAHEVVDGIRIAMHALQVEKTLVAIENNKPEAQDAMREAARAFDEITIVPVPVRYPMGSEKHLVQALTGKETPARALTADIGVVVHNIATVRAVQQAIRFGKPLISRVVTVSGGAIKNPSNLLVPIGTTVAQLIEACGGFTEDPERLLSGGPMMGQPLPSTEVPVVKGTSGILALNKKEAASKEAMPCIRCGSCVTACPCGLLPLEMAARARAGDLDGAASYGLTDCVSCGSCSYVCPAHIPLVQYFNYAKGALTEQQRAKHKQEETKRLAEARNERMEKIKQAKKEMMAKRKAEAAAKKAKEKAEAEAQAAEEGSMDAKTKEAPAEENEKVGT